MKKILLIIFIIINIFIIYILNIDKKTYYVNLSDNKVEYSTIIKNKIGKKLEKYINYTNNDYRVTDLINDINDNIEIKDNQTIQNALIKADILTIKIGNNELNYKANNKNINELFEYSDELIDDIEELFKLIRIYDKEKIYFIGFKNDKTSYYDEIYEYLNLKLKDLCSNYDIIFVDNISDDAIANKILK